MGWVGREIHRDRDSDFGDLGGLRGGESSRRRDSCVLEILIC